MARASVSGAAAVVRNLQRIRAMQNRIAAAALRKAAVGVRGEVRREIASSENIPLKVTRRRVQWFWESKRGASGPRIKFWVGTRYPVTAKEVPRLAKRTDSTVNLEELRLPILSRVARSFTPRFVKEYRSQMRRFLATQRR